MSFNAAIIGCGNIAGGYDQKVPTEWSLTHAGAYHLCPDTRLVAVADTEPSVLKAFQNKWNVESGYVDYIEMLKHEDIDILSLCLPTEYHYQAFKAAVNHNIKAIYCEKPLSHDLDEAHQMVELSQGRVVSVNYFRRWNPKLARVAEEIKGGSFGKGINAIVRYTKGVFVNGSHMVDLMRWFFGEPQKMNLISTAYDDTADPGVDFFLAFNGGVGAYFINVPDANYVFIDVDFLTESGRIVIGQRGQAITRFSVVQDPHYQFNILAGGRVEQTDWRNCTLRAVVEIVDCLQTGGTTSCTVEDCYRTLEVCHQILDKRKETTD